MVNGRIRGERTWPRRRLEGLERVLGANALFSTAYGNVGSSIYYALGLVASYALGPDAGRLHHHRRLLLLHGRHLRRGDGDVPGGRRLARRSRAARSTSSGRSSPPGRRCSPTRSRSPSRRSSCRTTSAACSGSALRHSPGRHHRRRVVIAVLARDQRLRRQGVHRRQRRARGHRLHDPAAAGAHRRVPRALARHAGRQRPPRRRARRGRTSSSRSRSACSPTRASRRSRTWPRRPRTRPRRSRPRSTACGIAVFAIYFTLPAVALSALPVTQHADGDYTRSWACPRSRAASPATRSSASSSRSTSGRCSTPAEIYVGLLAATILFLATNAGIIGVSRLVYSMGIHRQMPDRAAAAAPEVPHALDRHPRLLRRRDPAHAPGPGRPSWAASTRSARCCRSRSRTRR